MEQGRCQALIGEHQCERPAGHTGGAPRRRDCLDHGFPPPRQDGESSEGG